MLVPLLYSWYLTVIQKYVGEQFPYSVGIYILIIVYGFHLDTNLKLTRAIGCLNSAISKIEGIQYSLHK